MAPLIEPKPRAGRTGSRKRRSQIARGGRTCTLLVRIARRARRRRGQGLVVTFDDVTELLSAQRKAAWADVARRIAHEIKNPLTPIQLSAERLKRKYLKEIGNDPETFTICTDTIIRHVGDIGRMVDEFSSFARMPAPVIRDEDLAELCARRVFLQRTAHARHRASSSICRHAGAAALRCTPGQPGAHQPAQERGRVDPGRAMGDVAAGARSWLRGRDERRTVDARGRG